MFSEKLNFLINITGVKNSDLAVAVCMDASHISRLRNGGRRLSKNQTYVMPMARYFSKHITQPFKRSIVADALHFPGGWPKDELAAADMIYKWLITEDSDEVLKIDSFLKGFARVGTASPTVSQSLSENTFSDMYSFCYYGIEGKQNAVVRLLKDVLKEEAPQTLLLFSDEELGWLYEDSDFAKEWSSLLAAVLQKGNRIKIIHTVSRDAGEMMQALIKWIPVYMTGSISPYYYPKLRDGLFQKTMFIAPKTAAIISSSVKHDISDMLNMYIVMPDALKALVTEYERYLSLCRPLIDIMNVTSSHRFFKEISDFEKISAPGIVFAPVPSLMSMPESLVGVFARSNPLFRQVWEEASKQLELFSEGNEFFEIILPPTKKQLAENAIPMPMNDFFCENSLCYTVEQYKEHLKNVIKLAKENPHYHAAVNGELVSNVMVYAKEDIGVVVAKANSPTVVFTLREPNMTAAFWSYMQRLIPTAEKKGTQSIEKLLEAL